MISVSNALLQLAVERLLAPEIARLQQRRADRQIVLGIAQAFGDRARRLPDLETEIPQQIKQELDDLLGMRRALVGQQEQQIDIGIRRQLAAPIAADRDDRHLLALGRVGERIGGLDREVVEHPDQLIDQKTLLGDGPRRRRRRPRSGAGFRRARLPAPPSAAAAGRPRSVAGGARCGNRPRQLVGERPPVDDLALPQDGGHASGSVVGRKSGARGLDARGSAFRHFAARTSLTNAGRHRP